MAWDVKMTWRPVRYYPVDADNKYYPLGTPGLVPDSAGDDLTTRPETHVYFLPFGKCQHSRGIPRTDITPMTWFDYAKERLEQAAFRDTITVLKALRPYVEPTTMQLAHEHALSAEEWQNILNGMREEWAYCFEEVFPALKPPEIP